MADKWTLMIAAAAVLSAAAILVIVSSLPPQQDTARVVSGFPYCLRVLQCANIAEFEGIPFEQMVIIAKNYDSCFEDYKIEQTCNVQVSQDIERFWELGYVSER